MSEDTGIDVLLLLGAKKNDRRNKGEN